MGFAALTANLFGAISGPAKGSVALSVGGRRACGAAFRIFAIPKTQSGRGVALQIYAAIRLRRLRDPIRHSLTP